MAEIVERRKMPCGPCYWGGMEEEHIQREVKKFAKQGAVAALEELGFYDANGKIDHEAVNDFGEVRGILKDWRDFKSATWKALVRWALYIALCLLAAKLGLADIWKIVKQ